MEEAPYRSSALSRPLPFCAEMDIAFEFRGFPMLEAVARVDTKELTTTQLEWEAGALNKLDQVVPAAGFLGGVRS